jgi:LacI family transcriptional regulator
MQDQDRVTIKDIAQQAQVSIATVSYVINQSRPVSAELTERVLHAIDDLGYYPDDIARSMRGQRTRTIGLIVPDSANPFFAEIARGVEDAGFEAGFSVILCNSNAMLEREVSYLELLQSKRVDGIILLPTCTDVDHVEPLVDRGFPLTVFYRETGDLNVDRFLIDNHAAAYLATEHLIGLGHEQIACIKPLSHTNPSGRRVDGFMKAMEDHNLKVSPVLMPQGDNLITGGERAACQLLESGEPFTAVFATNDAMAIGAMRALMDAGRCVPDDVSIIGFDDIMLASYVSPTLTTVRTPKRSAGKKAVEQLLQRIQKKVPEGPRTFPLETELIERASTVHRA